MKTANQVNADLGRNKWSNDTLSPLATKEYFKLSEKLIDDYEIAKSAMMGISFSKTFHQQKNMILATDKRLAIGRKKGGIRYKNFYLDYDKIVELEISQDYYMHSRIYATFKYEKTLWNLFTYKKKQTFEVMDPTSAFHFKRYLDKALIKKQKPKQKAKQKSEPKK